MVSQWRKQRQFADIFWFSTKKKNLDSSWGKIFFLRQLYPPNFTNDACQGPSNVPGKHFISRRKFPEWNNFQKTDVQSNPWIQSAILFIRCLRGLRFSGSWLRAPLKLLGTILPPCSRGFGVARTPDNNFSCNSQAVEMSYLSSYSRILGLFTCLIYPGYR